MGLANSYYRLPSVSSTLTCARQGLQARNRTGGRLESLHPIKGEAAVDAGAMWIHNAGEGNQLYDLVVNKLKLPTSDRIDYNAVTSFSSTGEKRTSRAAYLRIMAGWNSQVSPWQTQVVHTNAEGMTASSAPSGTSTAYQRTLPRAAWEWLPAR